MKKIKIKRKPGPKCRPAAELAQRVNISLPPEMRQYLDEKEKYPSEYFQRLMEDNPSFKYWKNKEKII